MQHAELAHAQTVIHRRTEGQLHAVEQPHYCPGHEMGTRMPHHRQAFGVLGGEEAEVDFAILGKGRICSDDLSVDLGGQRRLGQAGADFGGNINGSKATGILANGLVGQDDFEHFLQDT